MLARNAHPREKEKLSHTFHSQASSPVILASPYLPTLRIIGALNIIPPPVIVSTQRRLSHAGRPSKQLTYKHSNLSNLSCGRGPRRQTTALAKVPAQIFSD